MRKYIFIAIGGMLGAILRFSIKNIYLWSYHGSIPLHTLFINLTGSFLLGLILNVTFEIWNFDADVRLGMTVGFLGAYTTFSALCRETVKLMQVGNYFFAISYIIISSLLGLAAIYVGSIIAREINASFIKSKQEEVTTKMIEESEVD